MAQLGDSLDDFCDVSDWSAVASGQAQLTLGADAGPAGQPALRLDYDFKGGGGFVVARKSHCARDAGSVGAVDVACAARRPRTSSRSSSPIPVAATSGGGIATRSTSLPIGSSCASAAARWRSPGGRRVAERCTSSAHSKSRSLPGRGVAERYRCATCASRTFRSSLRRASRLRARPMATSRSTLSMPRRRQAGAAQTPRRPRGSRSTSAASTSMAVSSSTGGRPAPPALSKCRAPTTASRGRRLRPRHKPRANAATFTCRAAVARGICGCSCTSLLQAVDPMRSACSMCDRSTSRVHSPTSSTPSLRASRADITLAGCTASSRTGRLRALQAGRPRRS